MKRVLALLLSAASVWSAAAAGVAAADDAGTEIRNEGEMREEMTEEVVGDAPIHGWDHFRRLDALPRLNRGVKTLQFSSFDRTGGNEHDGFDGSYSFLRREGSMYVIAEDYGAGEIASIWFTRDEGDVRKTGKLVIELDGEVVLDAPLQDVVDGKLGEPFVFPFVANAEQSSGGVTIKVPMPYRESMKVRTSTNPYFYHLSYRKFPTAEGIRRFDPEEVPEDVFEAARSWGHADPKPEVPDQRELTEEFSLAPGESVTLAELEGSGVIRSLEFNFPDLVGAPPAEVVKDDGRAHMGTSAFSAAIDPRNEGVVLTRRYDSVSTDQTAEIYIDDELAARWTGQGVRPGGWVEEEVEIPAEFTAGKSEIRVRNDFVSAGLDFSEFRFFVDSVVDGERVRTDEIDVGPFYSGQQSEAAHDYEITNEKWSGSRSYILPGPLEDEREILRTDRLLEGLRLEVVADGKTRVDAPVGLFFGSGLGHYEVTSLMYQITEEGSYCAWWPMPYGEGIAIRLRNESEEALGLSRGIARYVEDEGVSEALRAPLPEIGYFNARYEASETRMGRDWIFLDVEGCGKVMGLNHAMASLVAGNARGYLEGDERFYIDDMKSPIWHGTGTEDFYEGGWYFNRGPFSDPMNGAPATEASGMYGTEIQSDSNYRLLIADAIDFGSMFSGGFEPGPQQDHPAHYQAVAFWYGYEALPVLLETDALSLGDEDSEATHHFTGDGEVQAMTSSFEGRMDRVGVPRKRRDTAGESCFRMALHPENRGARLVRVSSQAEGYQAAEVYVNDDFVGSWVQPLQNESHRWLEDSFEIPESFTRGLEEIEIRLVPEDDSPAWSASSYRAYCYLPAAEEAE